MFLKKQLQLIKKNRLKTVIIVNIKDFVTKEFVLDCEKAVLDFVKQRVDTFKYSKTFFNLHLLFKKYEQF